MKNMESISYDELKRITDNFSEERKIGQGAFGKVYKGTHNSKEIAVKVLHNYIDIDNQLFEQEFNNIWRLTHQNIVRLIGYCSQVQRAYVLLPSGRYGFADQEYRALCFEYMQNGSLEKHLREYDRLEWHTVYKIIKGTYEGLKYIHEECNMLHLDLKPDNILLDNDMVVKIADFGLSRVVNDKNTIITQTLCGTPGYIAPEHIDGGKLTNKCDIFSLGVVIIKMVTGPENNSRIEVPPEEFIDRAEEKWKSELQATCSDPLLVGEYCKQVRVCTEIALECVNNDRRKRPSILDIISKMDETEVAINKCRQLCVLTENEIMSVPGVEGGSLAAQAAMIASLRQAARDREVRRQLCTQHLLDALEPMLLSDEVGMQVNATAGVANLSLEAENKERIGKSKVLSWLETRFLKKRSNKRQGYFEQHGGQMLAMILKTEGFDFTFFDRGDIMKATRSFSNANIVGEGAHGAVYKGIISVRGTATTVAVKRCKQIDQSRTAEFVQELVILCRVNHPNIVRLLGCCLHFEAPMLVYEFVQNGTLNSLLHGKPRRCVTLATRLRIIAEVSDALTDLHSPPRTTFHGDVKPENILLGEGWVAKVSDFGCSTINSNVQVVPKGTLAYVDPEFMKDFQITDKTDVYNLGVVLMELLSRKKPQANEQNDLTKFFQEAMANGTLNELLDADVIMEEGAMGVIRQAAELARRCTSFPGKTRPAMGQVAEELRRLSNQMPERRDALQALQGSTPGYINATDDSGTTESYNVGSIAALSTKLAR